MQTAKMVADGWRTRQGFLSHSFIPSSFCTAPISSHTHSASKWDAAFATIKMTEEGNVIKTEDYSSANPLRGLAVESGASS